MERTNLHYFGEFVGVEGTRWGVGIYERDWTGGVTDLVFPADEPLTLSWSHADKHEVILGSSATLKAESMTDGEFVEIYSIEVGRIWLVVERDGHRWWRGYLDPEFYEEPYVTDSGYTVEFTFSDFGILKRRLLSGGVGKNSVRSLIAECMTGCGLGDYSIVEQLSTRWSADSALSLSDLYVTRGNWVDEYGEWMSEWDVLESVLQPLALKIVQRGGEIYVFDLHYLWLASSGSTVEWSGDDQVLGVDKVYNEVRINLSPYGDGKVGFGELRMKQGAFDWDSWLPWYMTKPFLDTDKGKVSFYSGWIEKKEEESDPDMGFTIFWDKEGSGVELGSGRYCYIHGFSSCDNVHCIGEVISYYDSLHAVPGYLNWGFNRSDIAAPELLFKTVRSRLDAGVKGKHWWRMTVEMLADIRYNPFSSGDRTDAWYNFYFKERGCWVFIPIVVRFYGDDGRVLYYQNTDVLFDTDSPMTAQSYHTGRWREAGSDTNVLPPGASEEYWGRFLSYLCYYDADDRAHSSGVGGGWKKNKSSIRRDYNTALSKTWKKRGDGEFLPLPTDSNGRVIGGEIEVEIWTGALMYDDNDGHLKDRWEYFFGIYTRSIAKGTGSDASGPFSDRFTDRHDLEWLGKQPFPFHWLLFKQVEIELVSRQTWKTPDMDDVEYRGVINQWAKEDIEIDTCCGTMSSVRPLARGLFRRQDNSQVKELYRAGRSTTAEQLLIGTLMSQYGSRKTLLRGSCHLGDTLPLCRFERSMPGKIFLVTEDEVRCREEEETIEMTELGEERYISEEEQEVLE